MKLFHTTLVELPNDCSLLLNVYYTLSYLWVTKTASVPELKDVKDMKEAGNPA